MNLFGDFLTTKNLVFIILLLILFKFVTLVSDIVLLFFACFVLACSLLPLVEILDKKIKNRTVSTVIVLVSSIVLLFAVILPMFTISIEQISLFAQTIPQKILELQNYVQNFHISGYKIWDYVNTENVISNSEDLAKGILSQSLNITLGFLQGIIVFIAIVTILFYLLNDTEYIKSKFIEFFPGKMKTHAKNIATKIGNKVGGYVIASIISGAAIWLLIALVLLILKVEYAFSLGLIAGVLDIIPVLGPTIALTLIILSAYKKGVIVVAISIIAFLGVQQLSNNVIRPVVFGKFMDLHPLVIIFSLLVGGKFGGLIGLILAPALAAIVTVLIDELYLKIINKEK